MASGALTSSRRALERLCRSSSKTPGMASIFRSSSRTRVAAVRAPRLRKLGRRVARTPSTSDWRAGLAGSSSRSKSAERTSLRRSRFSSFSNSALRSCISRGSRE